MNHWLSSFSCAAVLGWAASVGCTPAGTSAPASGVERTPSPIRDSELVAEVSSLQFHSAFWINLHHVLYAEAWARRAVPPRRSQAGALPALPPADLSTDQRAAWARAIDYYDRELAAKDLLFDETMDATRQVLVGSAGSEQPRSGLAPEHAAVIAAAAPVYRSHWWPAHDQVNRAWIADVVTRVRSLSPEVPDRLAKLYGTPWFASPVRVDVVVVANRQGAYTALAPEPAHVTASSNDPDSQQWAAAEIVFHEVSHALVRPIREAFDREARAASKSIPVLWHVALFYLTGEVVRQSLAARRVEYTQYLYATGLFERAWPDLRAPIESHWLPYIDGKVRLDEAVRDVVAACPGPAGQ
jgi:hypothetical protein